MAHANWETFSINHAGDSTCGYYVSPFGVVTKIHHNSVNVRVNGATISVNSGDLYVEDTAIYAMRGPQHGVFAQVWSGWEHNVSEPLTGMIAAGVYGYDGNSYVGVTQESIEWFYREALERFEKHQQGCKILIEWLKVGRVSKFNQGDQYIRDKFGVGIASAGDSK